jgi:2-dehydropantoate 2-reductase
MRIGIVGAGALGTLFGYRLARGHQVQLLDVDPTLVETIARNGIQLEGEEVRPVGISAHPRDLFSSQMLFVFVRATDTMRALRPFIRELNPTCTIVTLQSGVGNEDAIKATLGGAIALVVGATTESAISCGPGVARPLGRGVTIFGSGGAAHDVCQRAATVLTDAGLSTSVAYDIRPHLWGKLTANAAISPVAALLGRHNGIVLEQPDAGELARAIAQEAATVASAMRIALPFSDPWAYVRAIAEQTAALRNSMLVDLDNGAPTEIEILNGAIIAAGRRAGVPTPYNETMVRLIRAKEALARLH